MRKPLQQEVEIREAVDKAIAAWGKRHKIYMPPPYMAQHLIATGTIVTRQLISRRYNELGIMWDETIGLWIKKNKL